MNDSNTQQLIRPVSLPGLDIRNNVWLAPLAGGSTPAFRQIVSGLGSGLVTTELVSARGIAYSASVQGSFRYLEFGEEERPVAIQLFGFEPDDFSRAIELILNDSRLKSVDMFDINMGCPVPKVVKTGAGSALMQRPHLAADIVHACKAALAGTNKPLSVKIRQGYEADENIAADFACRLTEAGADLITVHARTRKQMYSGRANWSVIREVVEAVDRAIPIFGNGDVVDVDSARRLFETSGCDGIMIGRAALSNPWIFDQVNRELSGQTWTAPTLSEKFVVIRQHYHSLCAQVGADVGTREMRKSLVEYVKQQPMAAALRREATKVSAASDFERFLDQWATIVREHDSSAF